MSAQRLQGQQKSLLGITLVAASPARTVIALVVGFADRMHISVGFSTPCIQFVIRDTAVEEAITAFVTEGVAVKLITTTVFADILNAIVVCDAMDGN